jgi:predicted RNase H-related nuclease YkuK (DUF458 family)
MKNEVKVNWNIAPSDATHHGFVNNPDVIAWYKYEELDNVPRWSFWYTDGGVLSPQGWKMLDAGMVPMQLPVTPRPVNTMVAPVEEYVWIPGKNLPPIGEVVKVTLGERSDVYSRHFNEKEVEIVAHVKTSYGTPMAVYMVKDPDIHYVRQAIARCFSKVLTEDEKAEMALQERIVDIINDIGADSTDAVVVRTLIEKGYIKE